MDYLMLDSIIRPLLIDCMYVLWIYPVHCRLIDYFLWIYRLHEVLVDLDIHRKLIVTDL
jgi:hypothetical protein